MRAGFDQTFTRLKQKIHADEHWTIISDNQESSDCRET